MKKIVYMILIIAVIFPLAAVKKDYASDAVKEYGANKDFVIAVKHGKISCTEIYMNEFTLKAGKEKSKEEVVERMKSLMAIFKKETAPSCPKDNLLLTVKLKHDGKIREENLNMSLDNITYYYNHQGSDIRKIKESETKTNTGYAVSFIEPGE